MAFWISGLEFSSLDVELSPYTPGGIRIFSTLRFQPGPGFVFLVVLIASEPVPTSVIAGEVGALKPNSGKIFRFGNEPGILINTPGGEIKAFTAICTHLACTVQYRDDLEHIWCACHNGPYNLNGINIAGPPPRPLTPFKVNIKGDQIFASIES